MFNTALINLKYKVETPWYLLNNKLNKIVFGVKKSNEIAFKTKLSNLKKKYLNNDLDTWNFNGILLPNSPQIEKQILQIYADVLFVYCIHNDNYNSVLINELDKILPEGTYSYAQGDFDVTIKPNDIVIDAGAWIGDFSAYASAKEAVVYAFEPVKNTFEFL